MIDDIMFVFDKNFKRINNLINLYKQIQTHTKGRKSTNNLEILRAAVVLLHSSMEDFLRNLSAWKLPDADREIINKIPFSGVRAEKISLGDLTQYSNKTVKEVISISIENYLSKVSYSDVKDITRCLENIGIKITDKIKTHFSKLEEMMERRHHIVHQADRGNSTGKGHHRAKSINLRQVLKWKDTVDKLVLEVNKQIPRNGSIPA